MCKRKTIGLLIVLFCSTSALLAQMSGSYTVGSGGYASISAAIADIKSAGLAGDVTLHISSGTYTEYVDLTNLGNGAFTVTLVGEDLKTTIISPPYQAESFTEGIHVQNTDNVTIRNLTIEMPVESGGTQIGIYSQDASNLSLEGNMISSITGIAIVGGINIGVSSNIVVAESVALGIENINTVDIIHNTLHSELTGLRNNKAGGFDIFTQAVLVFDGVVSNVNVINNIFSGVVSEYADGNAAISFGIDGDFLGTSSTSNLTSNYNLFDSDLSMAVVGSEGISSLDNEALVGDLSLDDWDAMGYDLHSTSFSPDFIENTNFRARNEDFRFGTYLSEFSTDIDGETRIEGSVDVGADQYCISIENTEEVTECHSYEFAGLTLTESGEYLGRFVAVNGCDSLVTLNLTILGPSMGSDDVTAEGSYIWNDILYSESGSYEQTLTDQLGCDSIATLNLTIEPYLLEGDFIIGSSMEADFASFAEAVADLKYATLTGDVEYAVEAGTYNETLKISSINSGDFSISFIGEDKNTTILHPMESIDESGAGILINSTNNVIIQNLTLEMGDISSTKVSRSTNDTKGLSIIDADNIRMNDIELKNSNEAIDLNEDIFLIATGVYADGVSGMTIENSSFSGAGSHITITDYNGLEILNNTFQTAWEVIRNTGIGTNLLVENNDFTGPFRFAFELEQVENLSIKHNDLNGVDGMESWQAIRLRNTIHTVIEGNLIENVEVGIELTNDVDATVMNNELYALEDQYGKALEAVGTPNLVVVNNFFGDFVVLDFQTNLVFAHNTVVSKPLENPRDEVLLFEVNKGATGNLKAQFSNNIIVGGDRVESSLMYFPNTYDDPEGDYTVDIALDHNLYYLDNQTGLVPVMIYEAVSGSEISYNSLTDWQAGQVETSHDQNSQSFSPTFVAADDFHITNNTDYRFGTAIADVATDIDGDDRTGFITDVGADQYKTDVTMSGEYTIGTSAGADYATINEALTVYRDATITGDITFLLQEETFPENVDLSFLNNEDHHLTIKGSNRETSVIEVSEGGTIQLSQRQINLGGDPNGGAGIGIDESSNITLENFTLRGSVTAFAGVSAGIYAWDSESISIKSVNFEDANNYSIYSRNSGSISIEDCIFKGTVNEAIFDFLAQPGSTLTISGSEFSNYLIRAVQVNSLNGSVIANENSFESTVNSLTAFQSDFEILITQHTTFLNNTSSDGKVYIQTNKGSLVSGNRITSEDGIALSMFSGGIQSVYNNFLKSGASSGFEDASGHTNFIHNTVIGTQGSSFNFFGTAVNGNQLNVLNNIFVGEGGPSLDFSVTAESGLMNLDHNLIYSDINEAITTNVFQLDGVSVSPATFTLAEWQAVYSGSFDQNSLSFEPTFVAADDFHINSTDYRFGTYIDTLITDIDGDLRIEGAVDVGADQFCATYDEIVDIETCDSYTFDGVELTVSGQYQASFLSKLSCDSLVTLNLTILEPSASEETLAVCESYDWNGVTYEVSGTYQAMLTNAAGCDSTATLNLTILEATSSEENAVACGRYVWNENTYTTSGTYEQMFTNAAGCDSTAVLNLIISASAVCAPLAAPDELIEVLASPNPTKGLIRIEGVENQTRYHLSDLSGRIVQEGILADSNLTIEAKAGAYLLSFPSINKVVRVVKIE